MFHLVLAAAAFTPPASVAMRSAVAAVSRTPPVQAFQLPSFGLPDFGELFGGDDDFRLFPSDLEFTDVDGDSVVIRPKGPTVRAPRLRHSYGLCARAQLLMMMRLCRRLR